MRLLGWMLPRDGLARSALYLPTCFHLSPCLLSHSLAGLDAATKWSGSVSPLSLQLFPHSLAGLDAVTRWSGSVSPLSPHLFAFVSPLVSSRLLGWMLSQGGLARSALCLPLVSFCLPTCFLTRLLGWMLSRGGLARSSLCLPQVSFCLPTCFLTRLLGWMLSRDGLARSALCLPTCLHLSPHLLPHACWAGCCHKVVWLGQPFVSPLVCTCLPTGFLTRLLGWIRDGLARSALCLPTCLHLSPHLFPHACWAGCCHKVVWLGQLFVFRLFPFVPPLVS